MKIISVISQKGGVGKSTLIFNLAQNIKDNAKVCIVDMDYQGSLLNIAKNTDIPILGREAIKQVEELNADFVFIDTPPYLFEELSEVCKKSDLILIPSKIGILDLLAMQPTINAIKQNKAENKALIVLNMVKPNITLNEVIKERLEAFGIPISKNSISDLVAFSRSFLRNNLEENPKAQKQMDSLTKEVLTISIKN